MKNIHILKTDKPSRFSLNSSGKYHLTNQLHSNSPNFINQNIYITSDGEIKEGGWIMPFYGVPYLLVDLDCILDSDKKIILTTDQSLDGVQSIDDEFLEWFVKNPNCEEVEVIEDIKYFNIDELRERHINRLPHLYSEKIGYKIIIPKEEICSFCDGTGQVVSSTTISRYKTCDCKIIPKEEQKLEKIVSKEPSKFWEESDERVKERETLEEVAERLYKKGCNISEKTALIYRRIFINGTKWQKERMYSEEEVINILIKFNDCSLDFDFDSEVEDWFEQFKNK